MLTRVEGENGAGKSMSVFDSLDIACNGETFGEDMVREGAKFASIRVDFTDGSYIERTRDRNKQKVLAVDADGNEVIKADTVKDMTSEIQKFTGVTEVALSNDKEKESFQFISIDAPQTYMLGGSAYASNLRKLSKVVGGTGAETAKAKLESEVRNLNKERDVNVRMLQDIDKRFSEVWSQIDVPQLNELFRQMEYGEMIHLEFKGKIELVDRLLDNEDKALDFLEQLAAVYDQTSVDKKIADAKALSAGAATITQQIASVQKLLNVRQMLNKDIPQVPELTEVKEAESDYQFARERLERASDLLEEEERLIEIIEQLDADIADIDAQLVAAREEEMKQQAKAPVCGECGRPLVTA